MSIFILDGTQMTDRETTYRYLARTLRLSDYFGNNLDALADELSSFSSDSIIILQNTNSLIENMEKYGVKMIQVFEECAEENEFVFVRK